MPYIITTKHPSTNRLVYSREWVIDSRRAVATPEEAREQVWRSVSSDTLADVRPVGSMGDDVAAIDESGGRVGPLPDGTVIEVERITEADLRARIRPTHGRSLRPSQVIDAYNARKATA